MHWVKNMSEEKQLDSIYANLRPDYKLNIRRRDFETLEQLLDLGDKYETKISELESSKKS